MHAIESIESFSAELEFDVIPNERVLDKRHRPIINPLLKQFRIQPGLSAKGERRVECKLARIKILVEPCCDSPTQSRILPAPVRPLSAVETAAAIAS